MINIVVQALIITAVSALAETCDHSINRIKQGPEQFTDIIAAG